MKTEQNETLVTKGGGARKLTKQLDQWGIKQRKQAGAEMCQAQTSLS